MQNFLVSIIIPIYKVEPYIVRCIDSVLHQTYRHLEVILVDDCTPDRSMEIAREHIEKSPLSKDLRFVYLKHDHNRGLSAARNTGIDAATGEYVYFLDSDDEITEDCIESMLSIAEKYPGVDMVQGNCEVEEHNNYMEYIVSFDKNRWKTNLYINGTNIADNILLCSLFPATAWNKLVRRDIIVNNDLYFMEGILHEDDHWRWKINKYIKTIAFCHKFTYWYRVNNSASIMRTPDKTNSFLSHLKIYRDIAINNDSTLEKSFALRVMDLDYKRAYWGMVRQQKLVLIEIDKVMREFKDKKVPLLLRMHLWCSKLPNTILENRFFQILHSILCAISLR